MSLTINAQIDKIEPPFWFAGMHNQKCKLCSMVKTFTISSCNNKFSCNNQRQEDRKPKLHFVTINTKYLSPTIDILFKKNDEVAFTQKYTLKQRREKSAQRKGFDASDMIYLIMPDRFAMATQK
jgi:hypothetical protein